MRNPILRDHKSVTIYMLLWIVAAVFQFLFILPSYPNKVILLFASSLIQNFMLAFIFLGAWFGIRYIKIENQTPLYFVFNHLIYLIIILSIWILLSNTINYIILNRVFHEYQNAIAPIKYLLGIFSYLLFVSYLYLDNYYNSYLEKKQQEQNLEQSLKESELNLLKIQMNPHFIFNSLNSISSLTLIDPEKAHEMIIKMSDFLRYTVQASKEPMISLEKELDICKSYLEIEKIRFGSRINFTFNVEHEANKIDIPAMILQTLFENSVKHGVQHSLKSENIEFVATIKNNILNLTLTNTFDSTRNSYNSTKTGLKNVENRIQLIYDQGAYFNTTSENQLFIVHLKLPLK